MFTKKVTDVKMIVIDFTDLYMDILIKLDIPTQCRFS